jgi:hypothetical protein
LGQVPEAPPNIAMKRLFRNEEPFLLQQQLILQVHLSKPFTLL